MKKRVISFCLCINILFLCLYGRLFSLTVFPKEVNISSDIRVKEIAQSRGFIYDRNINPLVNNSIGYKVIIKPHNDTRMLFENQLDIYENLKKGYLTIMDSSVAVSSLPDNIKSLPVYNRYSENTAVHLIGYVNSSGNGVSGIEKYFDNELKNAGGNLSIAYSTDALGRQLTGEKTEIRDNGYYGKSGIILTIDRNAQLIAEDALKINKITKGCVVILHTKTNEILACASSPTYERNKLENHVNDTDSPFLNRCFEAFPVGSVFKVVTAAAALEENINLKSFNCTGKTEKSGRVFRCSKLEGHKEINLYSAIAESCNPYFIELGNMLESNTLINTAKSLGFSKKTDFGNSFTTASGVIPEEKELNSAAAIGNLSFGQGKLTATPIQIAALFSVIAQNGIYKSPTLIKGSITESNEKIYKNKEPENRILKENTCKILSEALLKTVTEGTGKKAYTPDISICGKTSTAQSGQYINKREVKYCWFAGYFPYENPEYTVCILKEDGSSGGEDCAPAAKYIAQRFISTQLSVKPTKS